MVYLFILLHYTELRYAKIRFEKNMSFGYILNIFLEFRKFQSQHFTKFILLRKKNGYRTAMSATIFMGAIFES